MDIEYSENTHERTVEDINVHRQITCIRLKYGPYSADGEKNWLHFLWHKWTTHTFEYNHLNALHPPTLVRTLSTIELFSWLMPTNSSFVWMWICARVCIWLDAPHTLIKNPKWRKRGCERLRVKVIFDEMGFSPTRSPFAFPSFCLWPISSGTMIGAAYTYSIRSTQSVRRATITNVHESVTCPANGWWSFFGGLWPLFPYLFQKSIYSGWSNSSDALKVKKER